MSLSRLAVAAGLLLGTPPGVSRAQDRMLGYINHIPAQSAAKAAERHEAVRQRRQGHPIIFHRGAVRVATENTLECYSAAIDLGADGVEIDVHRTRDGVLVLHHDDSIGRVFDGHGQIRDMTYYQLLQAKPKKELGPVGDDTRIPTLASFLELARRRAMLIHLDVKQAGVQDDIIKMIDRADMWDQLVEVNGGNADRIRPDTWNEGQPGPHNRVRLIPYAQNVPLWDGSDEEVGRALKDYVKKAEAESDRPFMFFGGRTHQERLARILGHKPATRPDPIPRDLRAWWGPDGLIGGLSAVLKPPPDALMRRVADRVLADFPAPPPFDWGEGELMAGMMRAGTVLDEPGYVKFVQDWADHWRAAGLPDLLRNGPNEKMKGYCGQWGPGYPVMLLYEKTGKPAYLEMGRQIAEFIMNEATRTKDGGLGHWGGNHQLWVDTLYMVGPPMTYLTKATGDPKYLDEAVRQLTIYQRHNQDAGGLFWHMYDEPTDRRVGTLWGRGNGWVVMTYVMVLEHLPPDAPEHRTLLADFRRQMEALLAVQDMKSHMWHTVLDHPETYLETSATAMILGSLVQADTLGLYRPADPELIPQTWAALAGKVDAEGRVFDVSGGTGPQDLKAYATKIKGTFTWGTGAFLMAAAALHD